VVVYLYRQWQPADLPWLERAMAVGAWESLSSEERAETHLLTVAGRAAQQLREVLGSGWGTAIVATTRPGYLTATVQPAGFVLLALGPDGTTDELNGHVIALWVDPRHRRRGLGRQLATWAEQVCEQCGIRKVKLWTGAHNTPGLALALQAGYQPEGLIGMKAL
jgi:GNAT superfamily N-acetyltransferase